MYTASHLASAFVLGALVQLLYPQGAKGPAEEHIHNISVVTRCLCGNSSESIGLSSELSCPTSARPAPAFSSLGLLVIEVIGLLVIEVIVGIILAWKCWSRARRATSVIPLRDRDGASSSPAARSSTHSSPLSRRSDIVERAARLRETQRREQTLVVAGQ